MAMTPYYYIVRQMPGLALRLALNDVPFYRRAVSYNVASNGPVNHALIRGENTVLMEFFQDAVNPLSPNARIMLDFVVLREEDDVIVHETKWPALLDLHKPEDRKLPLVHRTHFTIDTEIPKPLWADNPPEFFPPEGTDEQHEAVFQLHDAYRRQDVGAFLAATELKLADHKRYYGPTPGLDPISAERDYGAKLREPWDVAPYKPEELVFERWQEGRVAYVTRKDGGYALQATHRTDPKQAWNANLYLTREAGKWRIFR